MSTSRPEVSAGASPWPALWAMVIGFFMILVDATIVSVAMPAIMTDLGADVAGVIWVTSAYLLAYAVPLLVTGRLGDRFGPKRVYLVGLVVFTGASLWCGLTDTLQGLVLARVVQGLGAAIMSPQTMAVITRTFPAQRRGRAMALWGTTAGVASLVGPLLGGLLVDVAGWEAIFLINVPVGLVAFVLAVRLVPRLTPHPHRVDWAGVVLSAVGMFLLVFGLEEGEAYRWGPILGPVTVPMVIGAGVLVLGVFVWWQSRTRREPLVPLRLFGDRNYALANAGISLVSFSMIALMLPFMFYAQSVRGLDPTQAALLMIPLAIGSGGLAPWVGRLVDRHHPRLLISVGYLLGSGGLWWVSLQMTADGALWHLLAPMGMFGAANAFLWAPLSATATRNLPLPDAGAGAGFYNATRQVGAVLGSAAAAALITARLGVHVPGSAGLGTTGPGPVPPELAEALARTMSESVLLPAAALLVGLVLAQGFARPAMLVR